MLARHFRTKLSAFKFELSNKFFGSSNFPLTQCGEECINHIMQRIVNHSNPEISVFLQKGFAQITKEITGKALHALCVKGLSCLGILQTNTLINMYSKFGNIKAAKHVFDKMPHRNYASWNTMISGFVKMGLYKDARGLFIEMWDRGVEMNGYVIVSLLTAFSRSGYMSLEGVQVHSLVLKNGLLFDVYVSTTLLHFYGVYGFVSGARVLFEEMPERNVVSWTSLMVNCSDYGLFYEIIDLYQRMRYEGVSCNQNTFTIVISSCGDIGDELLVNQVLGHVVKSGLDNNTSVGNSLISTFGILKNTEVASYIFDHMDEHDTISWNSILGAFAHNGLLKESLWYLHLMRLNHSEVDETTLSTVISVCHLDDLKWGRGIHGLVLKMGLEADICISNTLLTMYFESGTYQDAEILFHGMREKDLISWNSMLAGYVIGGKFLEALKVLIELLHIKNAINFVTFASALSACANAHLVVEGLIVHALVIVSGLHKNLVVGNALVTMYGKCGMTCEAMKVFQNMPDKELVTWNALIGGYAESGEVNEALKTFNLMRESGMSLNYITLINILGSCCDPRNLLKHGMPLHAHILITGFESIEYVTNSLISMYASCGDLESSNYIFNALVNISSATWNAMVSAKAHHGQNEEALKLVLEMQRAEVDFDQFSLSAAIAASTNLAVLENGQHFHGLAIKLGLENYHFVKNATMDMYGKCGELSALLKMLPEPKKRSRLSWNVLISSFAKHGYSQKAIETFNEMLLHGSKPDHVTFVSLLSACSHGGLVDEGFRYFGSMMNDFGVPPAIEHCVCIVDLLGRLGRFSEAESFIEQMSVPPNDFVWRSLLAACKTHGHLELGKKAAKHLLEANPSDDSAYVLYSSICASSGRWQDMQGLRVKMVSENVKKKPAYSWVNV